MNRIIRNLIVAVPLATAALTMTPGAASAETPAPSPGPVIMLPADPDPEPKDIIAVPAPKPPQDIANPEPAPEPDPQFPDDKAPVPPQDDDPQVPEGPGDLTDVPDCTHGCDEDPTPDFPLGGGCFEDCDLPEEPQEPQEPKDEPKQNQGAPEADQNDTEVASITTPTRVDAGLGADHDNGLQLTWLLASGALVTAGGATLIARKKATA